jgi:hypothetical protein
MSLYSISVFADRQMPLMSCHSQASSLQPNTTRTEKGERQLLKRIPPDPDSRATFTGAYDCMPSRTGCGNTPRRRQTPGSL